MNPKTFNSSTRLLAFGVLAIFVMSFAISSVSASTIFSYDFDDGSLNTWTVTNVGVLPNSPWTNTGTYAEAKPGSDSLMGDTILSVTISTSGFQSIIVKYDRQIGGSFESNDNFTASWSVDGVNFTTIEYVTAPLGVDFSFQSKTFNLPAPANNNANFQLKFECNTNAISEFCRVDNVAVEGIIIPAPALSVSSVTIPSNSNKINVTIKNTGNSPLSNMNVEKQSGDFDVTITPSLISSLAVGASVNVEVAITNLLSSLNAGENSIILKATSSDGTSSTGMVKFEKSFCDVGPQNDTSLEFDVSINNKGKGTDSEWKFLDTVEVEVDLDNSGVDTQDIIFELGLFKKGSSKNVADDLIWLSDEDESYQFGDIDEDENGNHVFEFRVNPDKLDNGDYVLVVKAYSDSDEDKVCIDYSNDLSDSEFGSSSKSFAEIKIDKESSKGKMVVVDTYSLSGMTVQCGQSVSLSADVYNIGDEDFEDQIKVNLFNNELGISLNDVILGDFDAGDKGIANFIFTVPQNASDKMYFLSMSTEYDYDKKKDRYDEVSEEAFRVQLNVQGCSVNPDVLISASLGSDAISGGEMSINVVITNSKNSLRVFTIEATGYQTWAELLESPSAQTVGPQSAGETTIRFRVKDDISGEQPFVLRIFENGSLIATQSVSVNIEPKSSFGFTGFAIGGDNAYLWGMGLLNVILLVVIIVVAIRFSRK